MRKTLKKIEGVLVVTMFIILTIGFIRLALVGIPEGTLLHTIYTVIAITFGIIWIINLIWKLVRRRAKSSITPIQLDNVLLTGTDDEIKDAIGKIRKRDAILFKPVILKYKTRIESIEGLL